MLTKEVLFLLLGSIAISVPGFADVQADKPVLEGLNNTTAVPATSNIKFGYNNTSRDPLPISFEASFILGGTKIPAGVNVSKVVVEANARVKMVIVATAQVRASSTGRSNLVFEGKASGGSATSSATATLTVDIEASSKEKKN